MIRSTERLCELAGTKQTKPTTSKDVNAAIRKYGYEIRKGRGYWYFMPYKGSKAELLDNSSVYVYRITDYTVDQWVQELKWMMNNE